MAQASIGGRASRVRSVLRDLRILIRGVYGEINEAHRYVSAAMAGAFDKESGRRPGDITISEGVGRHNREAWQTVGDSMREAMMLIPDEPDISADKADALRQVRADFLSRDQRAAEIAERLGAEVE